jgi:hypothetical protein
MLLNLFTKSEQDYQIASTMKLRDNIQEHQAGMNRENVDSMIMDKVANRKVKLGLEL